MSVFDRMFKLKNLSSSDQQKKNAINVLMNATHNKMTTAETERIYDIILTEAMSLDDNLARIKQGLSLMTYLKEDWLTKEEKENFVAGVWLCECCFDSNSNKGITYINPEELKYTKQAVLGNIFKAAY